MIGLIIISVSIIILLQVDFTYKVNVNDFNEEYTWLDKKSKDYDKNNK